jgi:cobalt-zinc-cadmium resistance protein CzcA
MKRLGITLQQVQNAIANSNFNVGGDFLPQGRTVLVVRSLGVLGGGQDPMEAACGMKTPEEAAKYLREEDEQRLREIREIVITSINSVPIRVDDIVQGGPRGAANAVSFSLSTGKDVGVVVGHQTRLGKDSMSRPLNAEHTKWQIEDEVVQGIVLLRKNHAALPALEELKKKIKELNPKVDEHGNPVLDAEGHPIGSGRLLPGVKIDTYYDRTDLINITTHTVQHNLVMGMVLVTVILLMFLSNVRSALIVAVNIPLALLFAFAVMFLRGKSANLLSIGAVDFGIIVDSSVIMVENIYRHISSGEYAELPLKERIIKASHEVERSLFFSTAIMICAFIPLFTMSGPEGQIFGPMADTYAFALGGALLLALTIAPVLCLLFFKNLKPARDNWLVRWLKSGYLKQLERCLRHRYLTLGFFVALILITVFGMLPFLGREFMPELEEGNLWIRGTFPVNVSLEAVATQVRTAQQIMTSYPEVEMLVVQMGRPDDGTDPNGYNNIEFFVPLRPEHDWPLVERGGKRRRRKKPELIAEMNKELNNKIIGVDWNFSQNIRDNVMESLSGVKGDNSVKIFGPDLARLESLAEKVRNRLDTVPGIEGNTGIFRIMGQSNFEFRVDRKKCQRWGVQVADVNNVIDSAVRGKGLTQMVEGEKLIDLALRFPKYQRDDPTAIFDLPVDVIQNTVTGPPTPSAAQTPFTGPSTGVPQQGTSIAMPAISGSAANATFNNFLPRLTLRDLVSPVGPNGRIDAKGHFVRPGASIITREQGRRFIGIKFSVRERDLAGAVAEAQEKTEEVLTSDPSYEAKWSGEFEEMEAAEGKLLVIIPLSLGLIFMLLYMAFRSVLDALVILSNVLALALGGVWALLLTGTYFSISAAVGFISLFGVAIMDGLLMVSYFNQLRRQGLPVREAVMLGAEKRVRPIMMTALTAIFGLLPAAVSTEIGAQTQQPLAIVVVGGMITTLFLTRYLMPVLYSFYGHREPPAEAGSLAH